MAGQEDKRYIKSPWNLTKYGEGYWYSEFTGKWVTRQVQVFENAVLVGGIDTGLGDQSLSKFQKAAKQTGFKYSEITAEEFEAIWTEDVEAPGTDQA